MTPSVAKRKAALSDFASQREKKVGKKKLRPGKDRRMGMSGSEKKKTPEGTGVGKKKRTSLADLVAETGGDDDETGSSSQTRLAIGFCSQQNRMVCRQT